MGRVRAGVVALLVLGVIGYPGRADASCAGGCGKFEPPDGKTLVIIGQDKNEMNAYVSEVGITPAGFMSYATIGAPALGTSQEYDQGGGVQHAQHQVNNYPNSVIQIGLHMVGQTEAVALGLLNPQIQQLATWIKQTERPVFLRVGYEFDGKQNGVYKYEPASYISAFRHIVNQMRNVHDVTNVAFVWHASQGPEPFANWYPGNAYVDWAGVSMFATPWNNVFTKATNVANYAAARNKPVMVAESTPRGNPYGPALNGQPSWDGWFEPVANFIAERDIKAWSYINQDWEAQSAFAGKDPAWGDTRIQGDPGPPLNLGVESQWLAELADPRYLNASPTLFSQIGF